MYLVHGRERTRKCQRGRESGRTSPKGELEEAIGGVRELDGSLRRGVGGRWEREVKRALNEEEGVERGPRRRGERER